MVYDSLGQKRTVKSLVKIIYNCGACKHWIKNEDPFDDYLIGHLTFAVGRCDGPAESYFDVLDMKADQMAVRCGHDGGITTGENFGCIHYAKQAIDEPKIVTNADRAGVTSNRGQKDPCPTIKKL